MEGLEVSPARLAPAKASDIAAFEKQWKVKLPEDVRAFLRRGLRYMDGSTHGEDGAYIGFDFMSLKSMASTMKLYQGLLEHYDEDENEDEYELLSHGVALSYRERRKPQRSRSASLTLGSTVYRRICLVASSNLYWVPKRWGWPACISQRSHVAAVSQSPDGWPLRAASAASSRARAKSSSVAAEFVPGAAVPAPRVAADVHVAQRQVRKLADLIRDLLDVSRLVHGKLSLNLEDVDVAALTREVLAGLAPEAARASPSKSSTT